MDLTELTNKLATAHGLKGKEQTQQYGEALNLALELFPELAAAVTTNVTEMVMSRSNYASPKDHSVAQTFNHVFGIVPELRAAYYYIVIAPLYVDSEYRHYVRRYWLENDRKNDYVKR